MSYKIIILLFWSLWCFFHSFLISVRINKLIHTNSMLTRWFRLIYNLFSLGTFALLIHLTLRLDQYQFALPKYLSIVQIIFFLTSFYFFYSGSKRYDMLKFLGVKADRDPIVLDKGLVRHPWYTGTFLFIWALPTYSFFTLAIRVILSLYLFIGTLLEERKLLLELGDQYKNYMKKTPRYLPRFMSNHLK